MKISAIILIMLFLLLLPFKTVKAPPPIITEVENTSWSDIPEKRKPVKVAQIKKTIVSKRVSKTRGPVYYSEITAYCSCYRCTGKTPDNPRYGITSTGAKATQFRTVAVGRNFLKSGTKLKIDLPMFAGIVFVVEDSFGNVDKGTRIDVYFNSHQEAVEFGRKRNVKVTIMQ